MRAYTAAALAALFLGGVGAARAGDEILSTLEQQRQVAVTIYNNDFALVRDARRLPLAAGGNRLAWRDVSAKIEPETALLRDLSHAQGFYLVEQNFDFDLLTPEKLLEKYVGHKIRVIKTNPATGAETSEEATVLSAAQGAVLKFSNRIESQPPGRLSYAAVPENLRDRPTLVIDLVAPMGGSQDLELSYLTAGLSWQADYVAELSSGDDSMALSGWVTLTNTSGASYRNAKLQLVAGEVNHVRRAEKGMIEEVVVTARKVAPSAMKEESLFEYHLYTLDHPTTISDNQTKQVALMSASAIPVRKEYLLSGYDFYYRSEAGEIGKKLKVAAFVEFDNKGESLGIPLPKGIVRVYKKDRDGSAQFVGEDQIDHTPKNESVVLRLGEAFDITADKRQTDYKRFDSPRNQFLAEEAFEIVLKNAKPEAVTVKVVEPVPGDWQILDESLSHTKAASNAAIWEVPVPAEGKAVLTYRVRLKF